jgi:flagellar basal-body rod protein FlgB
MSLSIDKHLGIHTQALELRSRRTEVLAGNLANADTPGYKARDLDFRAALSAAESSGGALNTTHANHIGGANGAGTNGDLLYNTPSQPSLDGNTVDLQQEKAKFAENAVQYQASLQFLNGKIASLRAAIRGD